MIDSNFHGYTLTLLEIGVMPCEIVPIQSLAHNFNLQRISPAVAESHDLCACFKGLHFKRPFEMIVFGATLRPPHPYGIAEPAIHMFNLQHVTATRSLSPEGKLLYTRDKGAIESPSQQAGFSPTYRRID